MIQLNIIARAVATSIKASGCFRAEEQKTACALIAKTSAADDLIDNMTYISNVSAIRQTLEKCGALKPKATDLTAFQREMISAVNALDAAIAEADAKAVAAKASASTPASAVPKK